MVNQYSNIEMILQINDWIRGSEIIANLPFFNY